MSRDAFGGRVIVFEEYMDVYLNLIEGEIDQLSPRADG